MSIVTINLVSPGGAAIAGAILEDGSTCKVIVRYDTATSHTDVLLDHGGELNFSQTDGDINCIDSGGHVWPISKVIDHSLLNNFD